MSYGLLVLNTNTLLLGSMDSYDNKMDEDC